MHPLIKNVRRNVSEFLIPTERLKSLARGDRDGSIIDRLVTRRVYRITMGMDEWRSAVDMAKQPGRHNRQQLYSLYEQSLEDAHVLSQVETTKKKILSEPFAIIDRVTGEIDEEKTDLLQRPWFDHYSRIAIDADFWGHSLIEFQGMTESRSDLVDEEINAVKLVPRVHVKPELGMVVIRPVDTKGLPFREEEFAKYLIEVGDPYDLGLLKVASKEVIYKNYSRTDWSRHSEKFGMPFLVVRTASTDEKELDGKADMAKNFGSNGWAILDDEDQIELLETTKTDAYKIYQENMKYSDEQNSKVINGQVGSSDEKAYVGSAKVHERILNTYIKGRLRALQGVNNFSLIPKLMDLGYPFDPKDDQFVYTALMASDEEDDPDSIETDPNDERQQSQQARAVKKPSASVQS